MRRLVWLTPGLLLIAGCVSTANVPPKVSWSYGAGNGDGVKYPGPPPKYSFAYGAGKDVSVSSGNHPTMGYAYGGDGTKGDMVQMAPQRPQQLAQPAPARNSTASSSHS